MHIFHIPLIEAVQHAIKQWLNTRYQSFWGLLPRGFALNAATSICRLKMDMIFYSQFVDELKR